MKKNAKGFAKEIRPNFFMDAALLFIFNTSKHALHERPHGSAASFIFCTNLIPFPPHSNFF